MVNLSIYESRIRRPGKEWGEWGLGYDASDLSSGRNHNHPSTAGGVSRESFAQFIAFKLIDEVSIYTVNSGELVVKNLEISAADPVKHNRIYDIGTGLVQESVVTDPDSLSDIYDAVKTAFVQKYGWDLKSSKVSEASIRGN